jgi:hypothetical protein
MWFLGNAPSERAEDGQEINNTNRIHLFCRIRHMLLFKEFVLDCDVQLADSDQLDTAQQKIVGGRKGTLGVNPSLLADN